MGVRWVNDKELMDSVIALRTEGNSYGEIATVLSERMGKPVTRNQIAGFLDRHYDGEPIKVARKKKARTKRPRVPVLGVVKMTIGPIVRAPVVEVVMDDSDPGVRLLDLTFFSCRWPVGDPRSEEFHFCGRAKSGLGAYCAEHHALAYRPPGPKRNSPAAKEKRLRDLQMLRINVREQKRA